MVPPQWNSCVGFTNPGLTLTKEHQIDRPKIDRTYPITISDSLSMWVKNHIMTWWTILMCFTLDYTKLPKMWNMTILTDVIPDNNNDKNNNDNSNNSNVCIYIYILGKTHILAFSWEIIWKDMEAPIQDEFDMNSLFKCWYSTSMLVYPSRVVCIYTQMLHVWNVFLHLGHFLKEM